MANAIYFIIGIIIYQSRQSFLSIFQPSALAIIPFAFLCCYPENLDRFTLAGVIITYLAISISLWIYNYFPDKLKHTSIFIGRNTLPILLFSPIFTILSKAFVPYFSFDNTGLCFMVMATVFVVIGCLGIAWCMDKVKISRWFCGKNNLLNYISAIPN